MQEPIVPVTGVARGGLGTATNLDDTQVYSLEELREPMPFDPEPVPIDPEPEPVPVQRPRATTVERQRTSVRQPAGGARRVGPVVVGALAVLGLAAILVLSGGGPGGLGGGITGAGSSAGTFAPFATTVPEPTGAPDGGNGKGNGKGNGNGNGGGGNGNN